MALADKHQEVLEQYFLCWNKTEAYQRVYPRVKRSSAASNAYRLFETAEFQEAISHRLNESVMYADEVLDRLAAQARGDVGDYLRHDPRTDDVLIDLPKAIEAKNTRLIKKLTQKRTTRRMGNGDELEEVVTSIEMYSSQDALVHIGKRHRLFVDRAEVTGPNGDPLTVVIQYADADPNAT